MQGGKSNPGIQKGKMNAQKTKSSMKIKNPQMKKKKKQDAYLEFGTVRNSVTITCI